MKKFLFFVFLVCFVQISNARELKVVIAPNLDAVITPINVAFEKQNKGAKVVVIPLVSGAAYQQIANGYPVDVFMSADVKYPKELVKNGFADKSSFYVYAIGKLVVWTKENLNLSNCIDVLLDKEVKRIAVANPQLAPYGVAAIEALKSAKIYGKVEKKLVYGTDVAQTLQLAQTANAQVAIVALDLVIKSDTGKYCLLNKDLYNPIDQAMVILKSSKEQVLAKKYLNFIKSPQVKAIFKKFGYGTT